MNINYTIITIIYINIIWSINRSGSIEISIITIKLGISKFVLVLEILILELKLSNRSCCPIK